MWPEWMRVKVAAEYSGLSAKYLYNLASAEAIATSKPSPTVLLFKRTDIDAYLMKFRKEAI